MSYPDAPPWSLAMQLLVVAVDVVLELGDAVLGLERLDVRLGDVVAPVVHEELVLDVDVLVRPPPTPRRTRPPMRPRTAAPPTARRMPPPTPARCWRCRRNRPPGRRWSRSGRPPPGSRASVTRVSAIRRSMVVEILFAHVAVPPPGPVACADRLSDLAREDQVRLLDASARRPDRPVRCPGSLPPPWRSGGGRSARPPVGLHPVLGLVAEVGALVDASRDRRPAVADGAGPSAGTTSSRSGRMATVTASPGVRVAVASVTVPAKDEAAIAPDGRRPVRRVDSSRPCPAGSSTCR